MSVGFSLLGVFSWALQRLVGGSREPLSHHPILPTLGELISSDFLGVEQKGWSPLPQGEWEQAGSVADPHSGRR